MKPTDSEVKEFWVWCGYRKSFIPATPYVDLDGHYCETLPPIDLNSLFRYAVPLYIDKIMAGHECSSDLAYAILFKKWLQKLELDIPHAADALFWAIKEATK